MIWHYTSMSVLHELMKPESKLYATHTSFVNDTQECRLAVQASATYVTLLCNLWRGALEIPSEEKVVKDIDGGELAPRFITCFSRSGDRLSQWRGYAPENGCSIGIDFDELRNSLLPSLCYPSKIDLADCVYKSAQELKEQIVGFSDEANRIHKMSNTIMDTFFKVGGEYSAEEREEKRKLRKAFELEIDNAATRAFASMFWKHQAFIEEQEVRLALLYDGGLPTRDIEVIGGVLRVGVRLKTPICALLREVVIGPGPDMARNALVARALCLKYGLKICIRESEIPFSGVSKR